VATSGRPPATDPLRVSEIPTTGRPLFQSFWLCVTLRPRVFPLLSRVRVLWMEARASLDDEWTKTVACVGDVRWPARKAGHAVRALVLQAINLMARGSEQRDDDDQRGVRHSTFLRAFNDQLRPGCVWASQKGRNEETSFVGKNDWAGSEPE